MTDIGTRARSATAQPQHTSRSRSFSSSALIYPLIVDSLLLAPRDRRLHPEDGLDGRDDRVHDDGDRPQHGRRLRRACSTSATSPSTRSARTRQGGSPRSSSTRSRSTSAPSGIPDGLPGIHISMWLDPADRRPADDARRDRDRPADAPAARRLPRHRHARIRRDRAAVRAERRQRRSASTSRTARSGSPRSTRSGSASIGAKLGLPESFRQSSERSQWYFWTAVVILLITVFCSVRLRDSRLGRAWIAIREDETAAAAMGIPLMRTKTWAYALGAFFGGVAGAFYASFKAGAFPADFYFNISVFLLCMVILGGMGSVWGVLLGGMILGYLNVEGLADDRLQDPAVRDPEVRELRPDEVPVRDLRDHHRADDALPADRADPRTAAQDRDGRGRPRHAVLRRPARGHAHRPGSVG